MLPSSVLEECWTYVIVFLVQAKAQQVRAVFARHNLLNEFDHWSDVSVWHGVRVVPTIFFFDGGALVRCSYRLWSMPGC
jgi:hypothetical protein